MDDEREDPQAPPGSNVSRRDFLRGMGGSLAATAALATGSESSQAAPSQGSVPSATGTRLKGVVRVTLDVNGQQLSADVEPRTTLANTLRDHLDLTGTKKVCDRGACGACTVLLDDKPVYSCMMLAVDAQGHRVRTIEGLGSPEKLSPLQEAFVEHDALMCGFCTPGFVMTTTALLESNPNPTLAQVRSACSGNVCRCGTYPRIFEAVLDAAARSKGG